MRKVAVLLAGEERVPVAAHDALNVARRDVEKETLGHVGDDDNGEMEGDVDEAALMGLLNREFEALVELIQPRTATPRHGQTPAPNVIIYPTSSLLPPKAFE